MSWFRNLFRGWFQGPPLLKAPCDTYRVTCVHPEVLDLADSLEHLRKCQDTAADELAHLIVLIDKAKSEVVHEEGRLRALREGVATLRAEFEEAQKLPTMRSMLDQVNYLKATNERLFEDVTKYARIAQDEQARRTNTARR